MVKKGSYSSKKCPCLVCQNMRGSCKRNCDGSIYCYHSSPDAAPSGYVHVRELSGGMGHEFIEPRIVDELLRAAKELQCRGKKASARDMSDLTSLPSSWAMAVQKAYPLEFPEWNNNSNLSYNKPKPKGAHTLMENFPQPSQQKILSEAERDEQYRQVLSQLQLQETHRNHLRDARGLGEFIEYIGFRSWQSSQVSNVSADLPGVVKRNGVLYLWGAKGIFLPMHNELEQIIAFQLLPDNRETGKYKWGSSAPVNGNCPRLDNGEMPLTFCRPQIIQVQSVGFVEGVLKAWSVACFLKQIVIGAPGAAWDCSPELLKRYLEKVAFDKNIRLKELIVDLYVDAGMLTNEHIMRRYYETIKLIQQWELKVRIAWWGQFTKEKLDIDDLIIQGKKCQITYISVNEWITLWSEEMRYCLLNSDAQFDTKEWVAPVQHLHRSELGYRKKMKGLEENLGWEWIPKAGFSFIVERELVGTNNAFGGLMLQVKRSYDSEKEQDRVVVPAEALHKVTDFINCLARSTGKVYLVNKLRQEELHKYLHKQLAAYRARGGKMYKLSERIGRQADGTWVFSDCQISTDGRFITESESGWVFNHALIALEQIPLPAINQNAETDVLKRLVSAMRNFFGESGFMPAFFTMAFNVAGLFYDEIQKLECFFPVLGLYGDAGTGKTAAANTALSLLGLDHRAALNKTSESAYHERFKLMGGLTQFLDDPDKAEITWISRQIKMHYGARSRLVRENNQDPHSALMVASNYSIGDDDPIVLSRLIRLVFEKTPLPVNFSELQSVSNICSCVLPDLIKFGYPQKEVKNLESQLITKLPSSHARLASSLALIGYYAFRLAELSGAVSSSEVWKYLLLLCSDANEDDSRKSSLDDFVDKLLVLRSQTEVGEWNCRLISEDNNQENRNYKSLAVYLHGVWSLMSRYFRNDLPYSQKMIRQQIEKVGGKTYSKQKFHCDRDSSITYQRWKVNIKADINGEIIMPKTPEMVVRSCVELPIDFLRERLSSFEGSFNHDLYNSDDKS